MQRILLEREIGLFSNLEGRTLSLYKKKLDEEFGLNLVSEYNAAKCIKLYRSYSWYAEELEKAIVEMDTLPELPEANEIHSSLKNDRNIGSGRVARHLSRLINKKSYESSNFDDLNLAPRHLAKRSKMILANRDTLRRFKNLNRRTAAPAVTPLYTLTIDGDDDALSNMLRLYDLRQDTDAIRACLNAHDPLNRTLLHAACIAGSPECLRIIVAKLGARVPELYTRDINSLTPSYHALQLGCLSTLEIILPLSPFCKAEELLIKPDQAHFSFLAVATHSDINILLLVTELLDEHTLAEHCYKNAALVKTLLTSKTGAGFLVLKNYIDENTLRAEVAQNNNIPFSTRCLVTAHIKALDRKNEIRHVPQQ